MSERVFRFVVREAYHPHLGKSWQVYDVELQAIRYMAAGSGARERAARRAAEIEREPAAPPSATAARAPRCQ